jgi:hypothetical protein
MVGDTTLWQIRTGKKTQIREETERRILSVGCEVARGRALIDAGPTWTLLNRLLKEGFTKTALAQALGYSTPALQINKKVVTASNAERVRKFYVKFLSGDWLDDELFGKRRNTMDVNYEGAA